jgi:hypothetical protein
MQIKKKALRVFFILRVWNYFYGTDEFFLLKYIPFKEWNNEDK